jgi:hypothetical protein
MGQDGTWDKMGHGTRRDTVGRDETWEKMGHGTRWDTGKDWMQENTGHEKTLDAGKHGTWDKMGHGTRQDTGKDGTWEKMGHRKRWDMRDATLDTSEGRRSERNNTLCKILIIPQVRATPPSLYQISSYHTQNPVHRQRSVA